jgi:putative transcriptional regulator
MTKAAFDAIMEGLDAAIAFQSGEIGGAKVHVVERATVVDVKALRDRLGMTQRAFAETFAFKLQTVQQWEQGRRIPRGPERTFLRVIEREPDAVRRALAD